MAYSLKPGRSQTGSLREVGGVWPRVVTPSVEPVANSQIATESHWKGISMDVHRLSSSSEDSSPRSQWHFEDESHPLKRCAVDVTLSLCAL